jgi:preprotein translocase subunit SecA
LVLKSVGNMMVKVFGSRNERVIKTYLSTVEEINRLEPEMRKLSDKALAGKTEEFRNRLFDGLGGKDDFTREQADVFLDQLLPEAFAVVREASIRVTRTPDPVNPRPMRHFDVQLVGGMVLHSGTIAEMVTGEGKTLVATLAAYLNALPGRGCHIITVNDFLATRDCEWMRPLYEFLGLTAGVITNQQAYEEKQAAYACDITYGKDSEFGFDYLRDNMRWTVDQQVQRRGLYYAVVDEVDNILIDEARTPLIISGPSEETTDKYYVADRIARILRKDEHFTVKEKEQQCLLTEAGIASVEKHLKVDSIYAGRNAEWPHQIEQALRAHNLYGLDDEYVSKDGEIIIVDEFTGRLMPGRRWSDGLHQAIEAKEGLNIKEEDQTMATVTYQNFFRMYKKLAGMTGTAMTEAAEFAKIYRLEVINLPTNLPLIRAEHPDLVFRTVKEKYDALVEEVVESNAAGRPVLVGTTSIEKSELLSDRLNRRGVKHDLLNAKQHEREAGIVFTAGQLGRVTIATNMAGRGTDIVLGKFTEEELLEHWKARGLAPKEARMSMDRDELDRLLVDHWAKHYLEDEEYADTKPEKRAAALNAVWKRMRMPALGFATDITQLGGLHIVGTERHEARRIDNQLRGRAGRQGDPGSSRFFLSLEDDLMRIFASEKVSAILRRIGMTDGMAIESRLISGRIEYAQKKVEEYNFEIRKHLLEYDEVMDEQRKAIYGLRQSVLENEDHKALVMGMIEERLNDELTDFVSSDDTASDRNGRPFCAWARSRGADIRIEEWEESDLDALKALVDERKRADWANASAKELAGASIAAAMDIFMPRDVAFFRWDYANFSRWARHHEMSLDAGDTADRFMEKLLTGVDTATQREYGEHEPLSLIDPLINQAIESYMAGAVAREEWDLDGLGAWAQALGISLPVNQWRQSEGESEEFESLKQQQAIVCETIRSRLDRALKRAKAGDVMARLARHEVMRRIRMLSEDEKGGLSRVLSWMDRVLAISLSESDVLAAFEAEQAALRDQLAQHLEGRLGNKPHDQAAAFCVSLMVDTILGYDLCAAGRNLAGFAEIMHRKYGLKLDPFELSKLHASEIGQLALEKIQEAYTAREVELGEKGMRRAERHLLLQKIDSKWKDHLLAMDHLKEGIGLRGYAQVDPKVEYTREARAFFDQMQAAVRLEVTALILRLEMREEEDAVESEDIWGGGEAVHAEAQGGPGSMMGGDIRDQQEAAIAGTERGDKPQPIRVARRVGRNAPCPCGSGKKFKQCCGRAR